MGVLRSKKLVYKDIFSILLLKWHNILVLLVLLVAINTALAICFKFIRKIIYWNKTTKLYHVGRFYYTTFINTVKKLQPYLIVAMKHNQIKLRSKEF